MEGFRTRHTQPGQQRKLLLPLSFGASSVSLLHILDKQHQAQMTRTGRTGFSLHILHITVTEKVDVDSMERIHLAKDRFPNHEFSTVSLYDIFAEDGLKSRRNGEANPSVISGNGDSSPRLENLLAALPSASSRADVLSILRTRLAVNFALMSSCEAILWGDSTTKLAERVLAETAKGRGFSLPWQVEDGESPYGVAFYYPMRDVLKKELLSHIDMIEPSLKALVSPDAFQSTQAPPSAKNTTIDALMQQYFESVEEYYPNIVSNVVRTTGKLHASDSTNRQVCRLCKLPVTDELLGTNGWEGDQTRTTAMERSEHELCYGCARSVPSGAVVFLPV
jgi:cytoplasmic tRNA 2-thiolation protein 2